MAERHTGGGQAMKLAAVTVDNYNWNSMYSIRMDTGQTGEPRTKRPKYDISKNCRKMSDILIDRDTQGCRFTQRARHREYFI